MGNILKKEEMQSIIKRIEGLEEGSKRLWGKMNVNEMICHCSDQIKMAAGIIPTRFIGNFISKTLLKWLIMGGMPAPKGKVETVRELKQGKGGTKPVDFEKDRAGLINLVADFDKLYIDGLFVVHPAFGKMNKRQWGKLCYAHLDHHLKQFGR